MSNRIASVCMCALLHVLLVSACTGFAAEPDNRGKPKMVVGMSAEALSGIDVRDAKASMKAWIEEVTRTTAHPIRGNTDVRIIMNEADMRDAVEKKEVNYVVALAIDYLRLKDLGLVGKDNALGIGGTLDEYVVLVNREGDIKDLEGLKQKKVLVQSGGLGEVPMIWLDTVLMKQGLPASRQFCPELKEVSKASAAVLPVFFGHADACVAVRKAFLTMTELNPQIGKRLNVLVQSQGFMRAVSWFGKDWNKENSDKYRTMMLDACHAPTVRQFVALLGSDAVVVWDPALLVPLEALLKDYDELRKKAEAGAARCDGVKTGSDAEPPPVTAPETSGRTDPQCSKEK